VYTEQLAAARYCPTCNLDLCGECVKIIHSIKGFAKHQVVELEKASVMGPPLCEVHKGRPKDLYCIDCKVCQADRDTVCEFITADRLPCICLYCWLLDHQRISPDFVNLCSYYMHSCMVTPRLNAGS